MVITPMRKLTYSPTDQQVTPAPKRRCLEELDYCWLDFLPLAACQRIAAYITGGLLTQKAIDLADTNERFRKAVVTELSHRYEYDEDISHLGWERIFMPDIKEIDLDQCVSESSLNGRMMQLLTATTLQKARVHTQEILCQFISVAPKLTELEIVLRKKNAKEWLFNALKKLKLYKLSFVCAANSGNFLCPFQDERYFSSSRNAIADCCKQLRSLEIICSCYEQQKKDVMVYAERKLQDPIWKCLQAMPSVKEVTIDEFVPDAVLSRVLSCSAVHILRAHDPARLAFRIGQTIQTLETRKPLTAAQVENLSGCPQLRSLKIFVAAGAENAFARVARTFTSLHTLNLTWQVREGFTDEQGRQNLDFSGYSSAMSGSILMSVKALPKLQNLEVGNVRIAMPELVSVMKFMGKRLNTFVTSVCNQVERPRNRLIALALAAMKYNPELRSFEATEDISVGQHNVMGRVMRSEKDMLVRVLNRLRQCAPHITWNGLDGLHSIAVL